MEAIGRYYDEMFGFGDILAENENFVLVRFDADPWIIRELPKGEK